MPHNLTTEVRGLFAHNADYLVASGILVRGVSANLRREPNNPHDRNAIAIYIKTYKIGYVPRALAAQLAPIFDKKCEYKATITNVGTKKYKRNLNVTASINIVISEEPPLDIDKHLIDSVNSLNGVCGVYKIFNKLNNRAYIGSSIDMGSRLKYHLRQLIAGTHSNPDLLHDWFKYGASAFDFVLLERTLESDRERREEHFIGVLGAFQNGYNRTKDGAANANPVSKKYRDKTKSIKISSMSSRGSVLPSKSGTGCLVYLVSSISLLCMFLIIVFS